MGRILDFLAAPWRAWTSYRLERLRIITAAQNEPVRELAGAMKEQSKVLQTWLEGFRVTEPPSSSTVRDEDEVQAERERVSGSMSPAQVAKMFEDIVSIDALE